MALTRASAAVVKTEEIVGTRNRIINGDMRIDQRNAGASLTFSNGSFSADRWIMDKSGSLAATVQQVADAPTGYLNSVRLTIPSGTVNATDFYGIRQVIENANFYDIGSTWGTSNPASFTISFWVKSSLAGKYFFSPRIPAVAHAPYSYTINAANTWEYKTITVTGPTNPSFTPTSQSTLNAGSFLSVRFSIVTGSSESGATEQVWANGAINGSGGANLAAAGGTWQITGVQVEAGSVATPFERRPYGTELALCHRYYYRQTPSGTAYYGSGFCDTTTISGIFVPFPVPMRTAVNAVEQSGTATHYRIQIPGNVLTCSSVPVFNFGDNWSAVVLFTVSSGLTVGQGCLGRSNSTSGYLGFNAEL